MPTVYLRIKGRVQGVYYRVSAKEQASRLNLAGWVRNTKEGDVEAVVSGPKEVLNQFISWSKMGPDNAVVTEVEIIEQEEQSFDGFTIRRDSA